MSDAKRELDLSPQGSAFPKRQRTTPDYEPHPLAQELRQWLEEQGGQLSPEVHIVYSDSGGFHLRASRALASPIVARCPLKLAISHLSLDPTQSLVPHVDSPLQKCLGKIPNHVLTYLLLVEQRHLAARGESQWQPYMACLPEPEAMTTPLWFDDTDMECLQGSNLVRATADKLGELANELEQALNVIKKLDVTITDAIDLKLFQWAATIVSSRAFISTHILPDRDTFPILFPVVDILNHSIDARAEWEFHPFEDFTLKIAGYEDIREGDEIFNNYAPKQNDELLLGYGFCIPHNPVEQFAIKMMLPPQIEEAAKELGLLKPENVPFSMSKDFLDCDQSTEQQYLRAQGHPFGRYQNNVPWLGGIPPWIVHIFFIRALMNFGIDPSEVSMDQPTGRIVLEVLLLLYEAINHRSRSLPVRTEPRTYRNQKQKYATIYRDGQAKIIHSILGELKAVIDRLTMSKEMRITEPVIVTTTEVLIVLAADFPHYFLKFEHGLTTQFGIDLSEQDLSQYSSQISMLEEDECPAELSVWKLLLFTFVYLLMTGEKSDSILYTWTRSLFDLHPLPALQSADDSSSLSDELLSDFVSAKNTNLPPISDLNEIGRNTNLEKRITSRKSAMPFWKDLPFDNLGDRVTLWADDLVDKYAFPLPEGSHAGQHGGEKICMYMQPWKEVGGKESWIYGDVGEKA